MSKVTKFEDLIAWQKTRRLVREIYRITNEGKFAKDFGLRDQIRRAAVSIMSNIAEGFERSSSAEFHRFLFTAKGSCAELRSQLYIAFDIDYLSKMEFERLLALSEEVARIIGGLRAAVEKQKDRK